MTHFLFSISLILVLIIIGLVYVFWPFDRKDGGR